MIRITNKQVEYIKKNYTVEEITYFYETVFFTDPEARDNKPFLRNTSVVKWNKDIYIKTFGDVSDEYLKELKSNVEYLNSLGLPIKIHLTEKENYNVSMYYGNIEFIEKSLGLKHNDLFRKNNAVGRYHCESTGYIGNSEIGIENSISTRRYKTNTVLEELTQSLGIIGDSYSHVNSTFYQGEKRLRYKEKLLRIDERILQLLYSDNIDIGLGIEEFYKAFADIIPNADITSQQYKEFEAFLVENSFSNESIQLFYQAAFSKGNDIINELHIQKWHNDISFTLSNNLKKVDSLAIINGINFLSEFIKKPTITLNTDENSNTNFYIGYYSKDKYAASSHLALGKDMLHYQIFYSDMHLPTSERFSETVKEKIVIQTFLNTLGLGNNSHLISVNPASYIFSSSYAKKPFFSQYDKEVIRLFFSETLKSGMTRREIMRILKKHYNSSELEVVDTLSKTH